MGRGGSFYRKSQDGGLGLQEGEGLRGRIGELGGGGDKFFFFGAEMSIKIGMDKIHERITVACLKDMQIDSLTVRAFPLFHGRGGSFTPIASTYDNGQWRLQEA